ncbi:MAG: peroxiredoxin family protein [Planctomycetota bacterium]
MRRRVLCLWTSLFLCTVAVAALPALPTLAALDTLPAFPTADWVNGPALTADSLKGKIAVLRFYDADCPTCRATWAQINPMVKKWKDEHNLVLIAINSGVSKAGVETYSQQVHLDDWHILVDRDRTFEKNFGFVISLQNIYQAFFLAPDGSLTRIDGAEPNMGQEIAQLYAQYKDQVHWKIDPKDVPASAKDLWQAYEFEQWPLVMKALPAAQRSNDPAVKAFAGKIDAAVNAEIARREAAAKAAVTGGDKWAGFKIYETVLSDFGTTTATRTAYNESARLRQDQKVNLEFAGRAVLLQAEDMLRDPNRKAQGRVYLQSLVDQYKGTEAAATAQTLLGKKD